MPIYAPVYPVTKHQQSFLARQQRQESNKRKREEHSSGDEDATSQVSAGSGPSRTVPSIAFHPVNKTDPYHIAGHPREQPLPPPPFPHAAVKEPRKKKLPIDEELATLNPPLYVPPTNAADKSTSFRRRHLDNVTAILHRCMLKGDWQRGSRAWALLLRTEIAGRGIDVRRNGRWGIGAEILMRDGGKAAQDDGAVLQKDTQDSSTNGSESGRRDVREPPFSDRGFKLAREYYERMILQYPHTPYTQHSFNATAIYPALFNIWIYEIQDRSKRARQRLKHSELGSARSSDDSVHIDIGDDESNDSVRQMRNDELEGALLIANRMDDLLLSPPYDTSTTLLQLRGMVAMWISDLYADLIDINEVSGRMDLDPNIENERYREESRVSRQKARDNFARLEASGVKLPRTATALLSDDSD